MRGGPLATMAMLVLIVPATTVSASPLQQTVVDICSRTPKVQEAILDYIDFNNPNVTTCSTVTATQLASITTLTVTGYSANSIVPADFAGLTGLTSLSIHASPALNAVPANAFSQVTNLTSLSLFYNSIRSIPEDAFAGLTALALSRGQLHLVAPRGCLRRPHRPGTPATPGEHPHDLGCGHLRRPHRPGFPRYR